VEETVKISTSSCVLLARQRRTSSWARQLAGSTSSVPTRLAGEVAVSFSRTAVIAWACTEGQDDLIWKLSEDELRSAYPLRPTQGRGANTRGDPFDRLPPTCRRSACGSTDASGRSGPREDWPNRCCRGGRSSYESSKSRARVATPTCDLAVLVLSSDTSASELARLRQLDHPFCDRTDAGDVSSCCPLTVCT